MNRLPNADLATIRREKVSGYLLNSEHPDGRSKCRFFVKFGFLREQPEPMLQALAEHPLTNAIDEAESKKRQGSEFGRKFAVLCSLRTPDGRDPCILTVWQIDHGHDVPYLVTAYPAKSAGQGTA